MSHVSKRLVWLGVLIVYICLVLTSYVSGLSMVLFILTMPWSNGIAVLGMLLIHMSSINLDNYLLLAGLINALLVLTQIVKRYK